MSPNINNQHFHVLMPIARHQTVG